ncbi:methionine--tRNA ligase [Enterobacteriaceae endosymbiont of Plateumaris consimilis]|uniref:methionine--tRNA ligase n=1 Tax=Enterobacteriaceae endosymbiont of Plateumaris consimilis TaxID=2675794 RepID=UPI0014490465|nr:methionine--tRNA ligase [Enterobacteriaceae endosymbiont of Plateumaris consimilis]QJC28445.1 methionine--tRNA ligase [Enterobacteriaceae endosymbiont of Plateumaris consimilis]
MMKYKKKILVTCALPYANGPIHLGHMLEHIQADIWVRHNKLYYSNEIYFICADDAHGTAIMLKSQELNITPEKMISQIHKQHISDFKKFNISYNNYYTTHSDENRLISNSIYLRLKKKNFIKKKIISQLFDHNYGLFLPDRFVKGTCPKCKTLNQYGDNCEVCGSTYNSIDLIKPISILSNTIPELRITEHYFFDLPQFTDKIKKWISSGVLQKSVEHKVKEWFISGLKLWDITRDTPYFGFKIPGTINKYFYVWLDAPIGYISTFKNLCNKNKKLNFYEWWNINSITELYHFIGKDIIYFHSLFWPAILEGSNFRKPTKLFVHGHVTLNGNKMSKSKGTFITAKNWLKYVDSDSLRFYYASKLSLNTDDIDLNLDDFVIQINNGIVNKIVNLASRTSYFINHFFNNKLSDNIDKKLYLNFVKKSEIIHNYFINLQFSHAVKEILKLADIANRYIDDEKPWLLAKKNITDLNIQNICSMGINMFRVIITYIKPIMPILSKKSEIFLKKKLNFNNLYYPLLGSEIKQFKILFKRIDINNLNKLIKLSKY